MGPRGVLVDPRPDRAGFYVTWVLSTGAFLKSGATELCAWSEVFDLRGAVSAGGLESAGGLAQKAQAACVEHQLGGGGLASGALAGRPTAAVVWICL